MRTESTSATNWKEIDSSYVGNLIARKAIDENDRLTLIANMHFLRLDGDMRTSQELLWDIRKILPSEHPMNERLARIIQHTMVG